MCLSGQVECVPLAFAGCDLLRSPAQVGLYRHLQRPCAKRARRTTIDSRPRGAHVDREAMTEEFGVDIRELRAQRIKNNEARSAALSLARRLTSVSAMRLAER